MKQKNWLLFLSILVFTFSLCIKQVKGQENSTNDNSGKLNIIQKENEKPGTTDWIITKVVRDANEPYDSGWHVRTLIQGYASRTSVSAGQNITFFVSTEPADKYRLDIFRMGYYQGKGGHLVKSMILKGTPQPTPKEGLNRVMECNWAQSTTLKIPKDWVSGVYLVKLSTLHTDGQAYMIFIVRDNRKADIIFQCSDMTWQAYNRWPQWHSLYDSPTDPWGSAGPVGYDISFDRPYAIYWNGYPSGFNPLTNGSGEFLMTGLPLVFWLEKEGYDVTYISETDTNDDGPGLLRAKVFLSVGHDEYWSSQMVANVTKARDAGVSLAFLSGNSVSGRIVLLPDAQGHPDRVIRKINPRYSDTAMELMGAYSRGVGLANWTCVAPNSWVFAGTGMEMGDSIAQLVGWEYQGPPLATDKEDMVVLAEGNVTKFYGQPTKRKYAATIYTCPKGNYVFDAATCWWDNLLSTPPGYMNPPYRFFSYGGNKDVRQITKNVINRMIAVSKINAP